MSDTEADDIGVMEGLLESDALGVPEREALGDEVADGEALARCETEAEPDGDAVAVACAEVEPVADVVTDAVALGYATDSHRTFVEVAVSTLPVNASTAV